uniref:Uncharacterized protein n=1 Tax=Stegastes partitus TaxID=144197 RepID=A0A3B4Z002_9TELE
MLEKQPPWVFSADGESDVIDGELDGPRVGHGFASPVVVLHGHLERHQPGLLRAQSHQLIHTRALEVELAAVEGAVVRVARGGARGVTDGSAGAHSVHHGAFLFGRARGLSARHHAQGGIALTEATADLISPEVLARLVVAALIGTTRPKFVSTTAVFPLRTTATSPSCTGRFSSSPFT